MHLFSHFRLHYKNDISLVLYYVWYYHMYISTLEKQKGVLSSQLTAAHISQPVRSFVRSFVSGSYDTYHVDS